MYIFKEFRGNSCFEVGRVGWSGEWRRSRVCRVVNVRFI